MLLLEWIALFFCGLIGNSLGLNHLSYYETLSHIHVLSSDFKRSSPVQSELVKRVQFYAFQRNFHLILKSGSPVLSRNFKARLVNKDGSSTRIYVDQSKLFTGHDANNAQVRVHAHLEESLWSIKVIEEREIYAIEPAWRILSASENPHNDTMVAYRMSDLRDVTNGYQFCSVPEEQNHPLHEDLIENRSDSQVLTYLPRASGGLRDKRHSNGKVCLMYLVGDADFYNKRCKKNYFSCLSLMIQHLQFVDDIYRSSSFQDRYGRRQKGIGVQIAEVMLFREYNSPSILDKLRHFNELNGDWTADTKLESFARYMYLAGHRYCLNHLFTEMADKTSTLGLAYINQLCRFHDYKNRKSFNSGLTTGTNKVGFLLPSLSISLVTSHGHNFGAHHDSDKVPECAPEDSHGGKFIMWALAVNGEHPNNKRFSPCTLRQIGRSVPASCFKERSQIHTFCGNGVIDAGEECDAGFYGSRGDNKCCTETCTLRPQAKCSEINHECCVDCQYAPAATVCEESIRIYSCQKQSYCSGTGTVCIDGGVLPDGSACGDVHKCYGGVCHDPCAQERRARKIQLMPCQCKGNATEGCMWCCYNATDPWNPGECKPILQQSRPDGSICYNGYCQSGECMPIIRPKVQTILTSYLQFYQRSTWMTLLSTNIVLLVIFGSLVVWVPASLWINSLDNEERRMLETYLNLLEEGEDEEEDSQDDEETVASFDQSMVIPHSPSKDSDNSFPDGTVIRFSTKLNAKSLGQPPSNQPPPGRPPSGRPQSSRPQSGRHRNSQAGGGSDNPPKGGVRFSEVTEKPYHDQDASWDSAFSKADSSLTYASSSQVGSTGTAGTTGTATSLWSRKLLQAGKIQQDSKL